MRVENLSIALRPRTAWEAIDLGVALTRQHARTVWLAWFAFTLPALVVANAVPWLLFGTPWAGWILMWWAKPLFDRIPLYVLSRAVFGEAPGVRETLRAQFRWGLRPMLPWLAFRRFISVNRAMLLPVDLLEGPRREARSARMRVLASGEGSQGVMLTIIALHIEAMLVFSLFFLALMYVPVEFLPDSAKAMWETLVETPPPWAQALINAVGWLATSIIEPFYVGAGFGLYLNRRTHLEAWDIELAFRRLAVRLAAPALAIFLVFAAWPPGLRAQDTDTPPAAAAGSEDADEDDEDDEAAARALLDHVDGRAQAAEDPPKVDAGRQSIEAVFGDELSPGGDAFAKSVGRAYADPALNRKGTELTWVERDPEKRADDKPDADTSFLAGAIAAVAAAIAESGLWIALAVLAVVLVRLRHVWLPWLSAAAAVVRGKQATVRASALEEPALPDLPDDVPGAVRALWAHGDARAALALLYRAGVQSLVAARGDPLPPGATESECLRAARALPGWPLADGFARIVACWRAAAYAKRLPDEAQIEALLATWQSAQVQPA